MKATLVKIQKKPSRYGGYFFYVFFKTKSGKSYYSCIYPKMRNYKVWKAYLREGIVLSGLHIKSGRLVDADSDVREV